MDPVIARAGHVVGLGEETLKSLFPNELTMWIDPNEVSYRIGENGSICVLYEYDKSESDSQSDTDKARTTPSPNSTGSLSSSCSSTSPLSSPSSSPNWYNNYSSSPPMNVNVNHKGLVTKNIKTNQNFIMSNPTSLSFNTQGMKSVSSKSSVNQNHNHIVGQHNEHKQQQQHQQQQQHKHSSSSNVNVIELMSDYNSVVI